MCKAAGNMPVVFQQQSYRWYLFCSTAAGRLHCFKPCAHCRTQDVTSLHAAGAGARAACGAPGRTAKLADKLLARPRRQLRDVHVLDTHAADDGLDVLHRAELVVPVRGRSGRS